MSIRFSGSRPRRITILRCNAAGCNVERPSEFPSVYINLLRKKAQAEGWSVAVRSKHSLVNDYCPAHASAVAGNAS